MRKKEYKSSFKIKIIFLISVLFTGLVSIISILNYRQNTVQITSRTLSQTKQIIEQLSVNIDTYFDELTRLTLTPYYNRDVMSLLENPNSTNSLTEKRIIETYLASAMTLPRDEVLRVYILTDSDIYSYTRTPYEMDDYGTYLNSSWYLDALSTTKPVLIPVHSECAYGQKKTQIISVARQIRSLSHGNPTLGVIKLDADYSGIKSICDKISFESKGGLYVIGENDEIVYSRNELNQTLSFQDMALSMQNSSTININGDKYYVTLVDSDVSGLKVIAINSYYEITRSERNNLKRTLLISLICLLFSTTLMVIIIDHSFGPLFDIINSMKEVQEGNLNLQVPVQNDDEIGYLATSYNNMIRHLEQAVDENTTLIKEVYTAQYLQKESQYNALCNQIKPHFFYNTLNAISLLIKCDEKEKAIAGIDNFSRFLRGVMNADKEITLQTELQLIQDYLCVIQLRYEDKISYEIHADTDMLSLAIPALILQPFVENAVKHGCECKRGHSLIKIYATRQNRCCEIIIEDDGIGISPPILEELRRNINLNTVQSEKTCDIFNEHIGIINVVNRLYLRYGNHSSFRIDSSVGKGTAITITIPITDERGDIDVSCINC